MTANNFDEDGRSFLSQQGCQELCQRIERIVHGGGKTAVRILSTWQNNIRWGRNRVMYLADIQRHRIQIDRFGPAEHAGLGSVSLNQIDDTSIQSAVRFAEQYQARGINIPRDFSFAEPEYVYPKTAIWSDRTYEQPAEERIAIVREVTDMAEQQGLLSAGDISITATGNADHVTGLRMLYAPMTQARCSITVRDPQGTGSGWAGRSSYDWSRFDAKALAAIALDKCVRSRNPVRIEPGRFTTILEPQATYDFVISKLLARGSTTLSFGTNATNEDATFYEPPEFVTTSEVGDAKPFRIAKTKTGQQLTDKRFTLSYSPEDPDLGVLPWLSGFRGPREPVRAMKWFDQGVLHLEYETSVYRSGTTGGWAFRMAGGDTSVEEMIATTKRGLLVTRFFDVGIVDRKSFLCNGLTRDGLWLIENGKISKAVKNMRFTESPLLALNNLEQLGTPVPVFSPDVPAVVPPMKIRDFSFTALTDAV